MGLESRLKERERVGRVMAMARLSDMKNKRKEVEAGEEEEEQQQGEHQKGLRAGVSEKRSKLNDSGEEVGEREELVRLVDNGRGDVEETSSESFLETVNGILEVRRRKSTRPLPVLMGDRGVDLLALHYQVNSMGGYRKVTEAGLWSFISDALGLGLERGPGLKLVFVKYLKLLETDRYSKEARTSQPSSTELRIRSARPDGRTSGWAEPNVEARPVIRGGEAVHDNVELIKVYDSAREHAHGDTRRRKEGESGTDDAGASLSDDEIIGGLPGRQENQLDCKQSQTSEDWAATYASVEHLARNPSDRGDEAHGSEEGPGTSEDWYEGEREENVQQQREALNGMLEWIKRVALSPGNPTAGLGAGSSGHDDDWVSQCQMLTAKVRSVLWEEPRGGDGYVQAKHLPSQYYDEAVRPDAQTLERLRNTRERLAQCGFQPPPGPYFRGGSSTHPDRNDGSYWGTSGTQGQRPRRQSVLHNELAISREKILRRMVQIGPRHQADVPPWVPRDLLHRSGDTTQDESAGEGPSSSDDEESEERWYGVRVWPQPGREKVNSSLRVGRGRPDSCDCEMPGSIECVRVHISASRAKLRSDLGPAFEQWGFDQMGECVAEQWRKKDERTFVSIYRTHRPSDKMNFWDYLPNALPFITRKEQISYYFNVLMLRRRALQNRLCDVKDDSDDDDVLLEISDDGGSTSTDDEDEEEDDDDDLSDGADDAGMEEMPDAYSLKGPNDTGMRKFRPHSDFHYNPTEGVEPHGDDRAQTASFVVDLDETVNHIAHDQADSSHVVLVWDDKHLESGSLVRDGALTQGRHWGGPHWDGRDHHQVSHVLGEAVSSRQLSPPIGKEDARQATVLGDLWSQNMEMAPKRENDRLLSTNGMILELFGDDVRNYGKDPRVSF